MVNEVKYGIISDIHRDPRIITQAIALLKKNNAEKLLINGDIGGFKGSLQNSQDYTGFILQEIANSDLEAFVQPGSHELIIIYEPVINYFSSKFPNRIINTLKIQKVELPDHHLVFLAGSDFSCGGEYQIGSQDIPSGKYFQSNDCLLHINNLNDYVSLLQKGAKDGFHYNNMNDLKKLVTNPEKTIVVCHIPRRFDNLEEAVDIAEFGEARIDFSLQSKPIRKGSVFPIEAAIKIYSSGYPIDIKKENRGNIDLKKVYEEIGIRKSVSGHFHEASHRANDRKSSHVKEGEYVPELFWNSGHLDAGYTGILTINGDLVKYQNLRLA